MNPVKLINFICVIIGSALIGWGVGSLAVGIGVFIVGFALLPTNV